MNANELKEVLELHKKWLNNDESGKRADLSNANLAGAILSNADLSNADLRRANLAGAILSNADLKRADLCDANLRVTDLRRADLRDANLCGTDLRRANLAGAILSNADLKRADLCDANLAGADLYNADLDFSCLPLWCFSLTSQMDDRQVIQLLYHTLSIAQNSKYVSEEMKSVLLTKTNLEIANRFHRVGECGVLKGVEE